MQPAAKTGKCSKTWPGHAGGQKFSDKIIWKFYPRMKFLGQKFSENFYQNFLRIFILRRMKILSCVG